jgi:serine phosphatase RsbU (regulator of sigma subunit)
VSRRTITIRQSLIGIQTIGILVLGLLLFATTFVGTRGTVQSLLDNMMRRTMDQTVRELYAFFAPTARAQAMAGEWIQSGLLDTLDPDDVHRLALSFLQQNDAIHAFILTDDLGNDHRVSRGDGEWIDVIVRPADSGFRQQTIRWKDGGARIAQKWVTAKVDPRSQSWYREAIERFTPNLLQGPDQQAVQDVFISDPYLKENRQIGVVTAVANQAPDGRLKVVAFEQELSALLDFTRSLNISKRGGVFLLDDQFRLLAIPEGPEFWRGDLLGWQLRRPSELGSSVVSDLLETLAQLEENNEVLRFSSNGELWWANLRQVPVGRDNDLVATVIVPDAELFADRTRMRRWILGLTTGALALAIGAAWTMARRFSEPIEQLVGYSNRLRRGDLGSRTPVSTPLVEIRSLVDSLEEMRRGLRSLLKLEGDLRVARQIQQSTLPATLPDIPGYDLAAWSEPAEETGGDTYDVTWGNDEQDQKVLHLLLADASGHGIGPALAVTQIRAMMRMALRLGGDLGTIARHLNEQLYADLPNNRFITAWLAELDVQSHTLTTFSAGQGPLLYYRAADHAVQQLVADYPPFGLFPKLEPRSRQPVVMAPGDLYVVLSDGFFEATDRSGHELGREAIAKIVEANASGSAEQLLEQLRTEVGSMEGEDEARDDRTAVILKRLDDGEQS